MITIEDFLSLKEANAKLERDNLRLKKEIFQLTEIKEQILPMKTDLIEKHIKQEKEKEAKILSLESIVSALRDQLLKKDKNEINDKNNHLLIQNQKLNEKICILKVQFKQKEDEFSEKRKQDEAEINNLKSRLLETFQQNSQNYNNEITKINSQLNSTIQILSRKYKALKIKSKVKIIELTQQNNEKEYEIQLLKEQIDQIKIKLQSLPQNKEEKMNFLVIQLF